MITPDKGNYPVSIYSTHPPNIRSQGEAVKEREKNIAKGKFLYGLKAIFFTFDGKPRPDTITKKMSSKVESKSNNVK